jgi:NADPH:quinone reductase-like Zn-dependent oxidoreductase
VRAIRICVWLLIAGWLAGTAAVYSTMYLRSGASANHQAVNLAEDEVYEAVVCDMFTSVHVRPMHGGRQDLSGEHSPVGFQVSGSGDCQDIADDSVPYFPPNSFVVHYHWAKRFDANTLEEVVMKAILRTKYGSPDVLQFMDVAKPTPKDDEILIKIRAASVNPLDWRILRGKPFLIRIGAFRKPKHKILGVDIAGRVEAVGGSVTQFRPGDEVFGGGKNLGGFAEYVCTAEDNLALKPVNLPFEDAAAIPVAAVSALQGLRDKGKIQQGQKVLIDGASGGVGTFALQIAKSFEAEVSAVCSTRNVDKARSLGADHVIDYTREDFTKSGQRYDLILAVNAYHSIFDYRRALSRDGICVIVGGDLAQVFKAILLGPLLSRIGRKKVSFVGAKINQTDLLFLKGLCEARKLVPTIDRRYPLSGVAEALRYLEEGHAQGKIVIIVEPGSDT